MTRVEFFFNVDDKLLKVADLCEKAMGKGRQLTVFCQHEAMMNGLHLQLWQHSPTSFLANAKSGDVGLAGEAQPIMLIENGEHLVHDDVLINLKTDTPPFFSRFRYLVEIVGHDEADKIAAREKYRFYRDRGYEVKSTDVSK